MERIPSECTIEMAEHGRAWQGSAVHKEGMLSGIYTGTSSGYVQHAAETGIVGHECWMNITSRKLSTFVNSAVVHIPVYVCLKVIHKPESEYAN